MKAFVAVLALVSCAQGGLIASPYAGYAGLPLGYSGLAGINGLGYTNGLTYASGYAPIAGATFAAAPYAAPIAAAPIAAPVAPAASQFNSADEFGNVNYGYSNINSAKHESGNADIGVTGSYSYVDAYGLTQTVNYVADGLGFRVAATNLPIARAVDLPQPVFDLVGPAPVEDTPEVMAAKAEFQKAFDAASAPAPAAESRKKRQVLAAAPLIAAPYNTVSAPAQREAVLTKIQLNPGHAVAYQVL